MRIVEVFPFYRNSLHYHKDPGQLPYYLRNCGHDVEIWTYRNNESIDDNDTRVRYLSQKEYRHNSLTDQRIFLKAIAKDAKRIDLLVLFHLTPLSIRLANTYKQRNKNGKVYIRLDGYKMYLDLIYIKRILPGFLRSFFRRKLDCIDLFSVEIDDDYFYLSHIGGLAEKMMYFPDDVDYEFKSTADITKKNKEKIFLSVARLDSAEKNISLAIDAFEKSGLAQSGWRLLLVGPTDNKSLVGLEIPGVEFVGPIYDRKKLCELYAKAYFYVSTSYRESFGISLAEAAYMGCILMSTDVGAARDLTSNFEFGGCLPFDSDKIARILVRYASLDGSILDGISSRQAAHSRRVMDYFKYTKMLLSKLGTGVNSEYD